MATPSGASAEAFGHKSTEETWPLASDLCVCPLVLAQLRVVICHCGNPWECKYTTVTLQGHDVDGSVSHCTTSRRPTKPPDPLPRSSVNSPSSDVLCSANSFDTAAADRQAGGQVVGTLDAGSGTAWRSTRRPSSSEINSLCTCDEAASCLHSSVKAIPGGENLFPDSSAPTQRVSVSGMLPCRRNDGPDAAEPQQFPPEAFINVLCCSRWKHAFRSTSRASACTDVCDIKAGMSGRAMFNERGVVCGLLLYEGQRFFEGRLLYKQLNGSLCWNEAAWNRLYHTLTCDVLPKAPAGSAADAACSTLTETHRVTSSSRQLPKISSSSCTSAGHVDKSLVVLHVIDAIEPKNTYNTQCVTSPQESLHTTVTRESLHCTEQEGAFTAEESINRHQVRCINCSPVYSARLEASTAVHTSGSGSRDPHAERCTSSSEDATTSATYDRVSPASRRLRATLFRRNSCSPAGDNLGRATGKPTHSCVSATSGGQPVGAYTLSLVMQLGAAPRAIYVRLAEPIRLQPLTLAAGVAKLTAAVLLMQRLHNDEQQKLQEQYSACVEALHRVTEDLAAAAAQQQKREDTLLEGACKLLNEKKRKLQALQQRVTLLEKQVQNACCSGDNCQCKHRAISRRQSCGLRVLTDGDQVITTLKSETGCTGPLQPNTSNQALTGSGRAPSRRVRDHSSGAGLALAVSQTCTGQLPKSPPRKRAVNFCGTPAGRSSGTANTVRYELRGKHPAGLFLVKNKRLFPAAFACIRIKEETLQA